MLYWHREDREVLMLLRLSVLTGEHANYSQIITKRSSLLTQFKITLLFLKAFSTNTLNFHQYFKDKLSSHQPSHMHNTRHRTNSNFNTLFNHLKTQKCYLYQVIPIWNSLPKLLKNCTSPKEVATGSSWDLPLCAPALETRV